jgi:hypothetical protein
MAVYLVTINTTAPVDLDLVMREATTWLAERVDEDGQHPINIAVYDLASRVVTEHDYDPEPIETPVSIHVEGVDPNVEWHA